MYARLSDIHFKPVSNCDTLQYLWLSDVNRERYPFCLSAHLYLSIYARSICPSLFSAGNNNNSNCITSRQAVKYLANLTAHVVVRRVGTVSAAGGRPPASCCNCGHLLGYGNYCLHGYGIGSRRTRHEPGYTRGKMGHPLTTNYCLRSHLLTVWVQQEWCGQARWPAGTASHQV